MFIFLYYNIVNISYFIKSFYKFLKILIRQADVNLPKVSRDNIKLARP